MSMVQPVSTSISSSVFGSPFRFGLATGIRSTPASTNTASFDLRPSGRSASRTDSRGQESTSPRLRDVS